MKERFASSAFLRRIIVLSCDLFIIASSYFLALFLRLDVAIFADTTFLLNLTRLLPVILAVHFIFCYIFKIYATLWKYVSVEEALRVALAILSSNIVIFLIGQQLFPLPRSVYVIATFIITALILGTRVLYRYLRLRRKESLRQQNALIIGAGDAGVLLSKEIVNNDDYNCRIVGFIDDDIRKRNRMISNHSILGTTDDLEKIVIKNDVSLIYIAISNISKENLTKIINKCIQINITPKLMSISEYNNQSITSVRDIKIEDLLNRGEIKLDNNEISSYIEGEVVCVTGAGGSIGSELVRQLLPFKPKEIICIDIAENGLYQLQQEIILQKRNGTVSSSVNLEYVIATVRDFDSLSQVLKTYQPKILYHAAAHKHVPLMETAPKEAIKNNVMGTFNTLNACIDNNVNKMILISTDKAVNPTNVMGASKRICELIIQGYRNNGVTSVSAVRFGNVLGSSGSVIPLFQDQIKSGGPVTITHPDITRFFMTIPEASQLVIQASIYAKPGNIFVLDMGKPVKIVKLAEDLIKLSGLKPYEDIKIEFIGLRPGEKLYEELSLGDEKRHKTSNDLIFVLESMDISKNFVRSIIDELHETMNSTNSCEEIRSKLLEIIK